jgi:hypothetical protein
MTKKATGAGRAKLMAVLGAAVLMMTASLAEAKGTSRGAKVKVDLGRGEAPVVGWLAGVRSDALVVETPQGSDRTIPVAGISKVHVYPKSAILPGILLGMAAGGAVGYGLSYPNYKDAFLGELGIAVDTGIGVAAGGLVGLIIGSPKTRAKSYDFANMTRDEIDRTLVKLRRKAGVRAYR